MPCPTFMIKSVQMNIDTYKIELSNVRLYAYHGVLPQETVVGAWYIVNLSAKIDCTDSIMNDEIDSTVSYALVYDVVNEEMQIKSRLLEHVAGRILERLFATFTLISEIEITLTKETPPLGGDSLSSSVAIKASR